jgi:hypothetical protein
VGLYAALFRALVVLVELLEHAPQGGADVVDAGVDGLAVLRALVAGDEAIGLLGFQRLRNLI